MALVCELETQASCAEKSWRVSNVANECLHGMYLDITFSFIIDNLFRHLKNLLPSGKRETDFVLCLLFI